VVVFGIRINGPSLTSRELDQAQYVVDGGDNDNID